MAVERIAGNLTRVLEVARDEAITTEAAAERVAERRIEAARRRAGTEPHPVSTGDRS